MPTQPTAGAKKVKKTIKIVGPKARKAAAALNATVDENLFTTNTIGQYQIVRLLGKGVSGTVYEATAKDGTPCAIKQVKLLGVSKADRAEMEQEIDLLKKLQHLNVVKHLETVVNDSLNIVLEYVDGGTLTDQLANFSKKPEALVAYYSLQILSGLAYIHSQGVIHRDLKGVNILSTRDGVVKLVDFGVAKMWAATKTHSVIGTPYWMAPEVIQMNAKESSACDIWSLGCTVVELLMGQPPFFGLHPMAALYQMVQVVSPPIDPACCSRECWDFLTLCFQQDPKKRPSAKQLLGHPWVVNSEKGGEDLVRASVIMMQNKWKEQRQKTQALIMRHTSQPATIARAPAVEVALIDIDDMVDMQNMTADLVTENLENRFCRGCIYTNISSILICINPYRNIDNLYSLAKLRQYHYKVARRDLEQAPHIFAIARSAFANAVSIDVAPGVNRNQAILISGESGAGKTEATKHILRYITAMSGSKSVDEISEPSTLDLGASFTIEEKLMQANPILEAFGNAKTLRNDNSSRFGKWISILLSASNYGAIVGASILKYLLEESRVVCPTLGERNFNIFYQVCGDAVSRYQDPSFNAQNFRYLVPTDSKDSKEAVKIAGVDDHVEFQRVVRAMHCLGFVEQERELTFGVIQAILRLGNVVFVTKDKAKEHASISPESNKHLPHIASALGLTEASLAETLCVKVQIIANQRIDRPRTVPEAMALVDAISKSLYGRLFTWIIWRINLALAHRATPGTPETSSQVAQRPGARRLSTVKEAQLAALNGSGPKDMPNTDSSATKLSQLQQADSAFRAPEAIATPSKATLARLQLADTTIGILDIFGFEVFQRNSLEQLCINLANETLQQYFIHYIFKLEQALYLQEKLNVDQMTYADNKQCVELLGGKFPGIFAMLHDELTIPGGSDNSLLDKIKREHQKHPFFGDGTNKVAPPGTFVIRHYAEPVCYHVEGFLEKNRSQTGDDVMALLQTSQQSVLALVYSSVYEVLGEHNPQKGLDAMTALREGKSSPEPKRMPSASPAPKRGKPAPQGSVGSKFQDSLKDLIASLEAATPHFVRCVKPNQLKKSNGPGGFDRPLVLNQLRTSGMLDSVTIRKMGYPERLPHAAFFNRYTHLYPGLTTQQAILERMAEAVYQKHPEEKAGPPLFQVGVTKVFLKPKAWSYLEIQRSLLLARSILIIQTFTRAIQARALVNKMKLAINALNQAIATGNLKAIDAALLVATKDGVNKRIIQSFWLKRTSIEQTLLTRKELSEVLLGKGPSLAIRLAALTISISRAQKAQQSFTEPSSSALLSLCVDLHSLFSHVAGEISRLRVLMETDEKCVRDAQMLLDDFPKQIVALLGRHLEGVPSGAVGGLSDNDLAFIRKELLWSASEASECLELKLAVKSLQALEKQLLDATNLAKYETWPQVVDALPVLKGHIDKTGIAKYRRPALSAVQALVTAIELEVVVSTALEQANRAGMSSALQVVNMELKSANLTLVDGAMVKLRDRFKQLADSGASSVAEAQASLSESLVLLEQTEVLHQFLTVRSLDMEKCLRCLDACQQLPGGQRPNPCAVKFVDVMHKVKKRVRQDAASNLQLVIATPSPDLALLSAAIDLGRRAGLSAQELTSASHFLELQQDLPRLIAAKQPAALQSLLVRVKAASSQVNPNERAEALLFQNLTASTEKALMLFTALEKLKLACAEMKAGNASPSTLQAAQDLLVEVGAADLDSTEIAPYQAAVQAYAREEESKQQQKLSKQQAELERQRVEEAENRRRAEEKKRAAEAEGKRLADEKERKRLVELVESKRQAEELERKQQEQLERERAEAERIRGEEKAAAEQAKKTAEAARCLSLLIDELEDNPDQVSHSGSRVSTAGVVSPRVRGPVIHHPPRLPSPAPVSLVFAEEKLLSQAPEERRSRSSHQPPGSPGLPSYGEALSTAPPPGLPTYEESLVSESMGRGSDSHVFDSINERESSVASFSQGSEHPIPLPGGRIICEGYLAKKSAGGIPLLRHWQKRYFVLRAPDKLQYFTDATKKEVRGIVPLECVENLFAKQLRITLVMEAVETKGKTKQRKFHLTAPSTADATRWIKAFETAFKEIDELEDQGLNS